MFRTIAIDGACLRNGEPTCRSAGAAFIINHTDAVEQSLIKAVSEYESTSQRGELIGLYLALSYIHSAPANTLIVTDSEYLFNIVTKDWITRWQKTGWVTASSSPVKNRDILEEISLYTSQLGDLISCFHIKGHLLSVGAKKAQKLLDKDDSGYTLYRHAFEGKDIPEAKISHAQELSRTNNGYSIELDVLKQFAAMNLVADEAAKRYLLIQEMEEWQSILN